jgi:hypothetical protein
MNVNQQIPNDKPSGSKGRPRRLRGAMVMVLLAAAAVAGCSRIPLGTLWSLRSFDVKQVDGAALRILAYLPSQVDTQRDAVKVHLTAQRGNPAAEVLEQTLALRPLAAIAASNLPPAPWPGGHWVALGLDEAEQARLTGLRQTMLAWKAADGEGVKRRLAMDATPQLCAKTAGLPVDQVTLDAWMRWRAGQDDLHLLAGAKGSDLDDKNAAAALPLCP